MRIYLLFLLIGILSSVTTTECNAQSESTTGPKKGSLVIAGGGKLEESIIKRFIELAGGTDAPIVIIPTALGAKSYDENYGGTKAFRDAGATNITVLHTDDRTEANSEDFVQPLREAKAVWFGGGRQWRLVDSYKDTKAEELFWQVLEKGGVIGGSSAGATIQGSYLARGDTKNNQIMMGDHEEGFNFIKNIAIDQHVLARNRQFDMFDILKNRPGLLGVSIDEGTAMVVQKNQFEVLGDSYVIVYDGSFWSREGSDLKTLPPNDKLFYFLREGDQYDLKKRKVISK
ncbi:MAG: cyanophycinase [Cyclobacteriaceae bacterium]